MAKKKKAHGGTREGSGRPSLSETGESVRVAVTLPSELLTQLDAAAKSRGLNRSEAVRDSVQLFLAQK